MQQLIELILFCATSAAFVLKPRFTSSRNRFADTTNQSNLVKALRDGTSLNADENVCTVDENNVPTKCGHPRSEMRLAKMWHRATYIIIRHIDPDQIDHTDDYDHLLLVQRRSNIKDYW